MHACMHTYIHAYCTYMHTCMHAYIHIYMCNCVYSDNFIAFKSLLSFGPRSTLSWVKEETFEKLEYDSLYIVN